MKIGSLFSGIDGLGLGLEWAGVGHVVWQVEKEPFARAVLAKHWPAAVRYDDVCTVGAHNLEPVDLICGGFPCQDISYAGTGDGLEGERSGLWFQFERIVRDLRPRYVVIENVAALLTRGIDVVLGGLATLGYDAWWDCVRASDVGAPHRRERIFVVAWLVADAAGARRGAPAAREDGGRVPAALGGGSHGVAHPDGERAQGDGLRERQRGVDALAAERGADGVADAGSGGRLGWPGEHSDRRDGHAVRWTAEHGDARDGDPAGVANTDGARQHQSTVCLEEVGDRTRHGSPRMADAPGVGEREPADEADPFAIEWDARDEPGDSGELADAAHVGRERVEAREERAGQRAAEPTGERLAHAACVGCDTQESVGGVDGGGREAARGASLGDAGGATQPGLGRAVDGFPEGLHGRWPARPGQAQHEWEAPRTAYGVPHRKERLTALSNAVLPAVSYVIGRVVLAIDAALRAEADSFSIDFSEYTSTPGDTP